MLRYGGPAGAAAARALPYIGWATTIGLGIYEMQQALQGNQVEAVTNASNINALLDQQQKRFDQELARERNRQNARDVAAAYVRGLTESALKTPPAPPAPPAPVAAPVGTIGTVTLPPPTMKQRIAARWAKVQASPLFLPVLGGILAKVVQPGSGSRQAPTDFPLEEFPPDLTGFETGPVEFLGGQLGGVDFSALPQEDVAVSPEGCEDIDPPREPGQCRQGWFSETPTKIFFKEWSRRPCQ